MYLQGSAMFASSLQVKIVRGLPEENVATTLPSVTATFLVILQGIPVYIYT